MVHSRLYGSIALVALALATAVGRELDMTMRGGGRTQMNEIMLYEVKDGQIVREQFFY